MRYIKKQKYLKSNYLKSEVSRLVPNIEKLIDLGYVPSTKVQEGFNKTILSYYEEN